MGVCWGGDEGGGGDGGGDRPDVNDDWELPVICSLVFSWTNTIAVSTHMIDPVCFAL